MYKIEPLLSVSNKNHITWLNCAKLIAILGVIVDHTINTLYKNPNIANASYYSVSLFIIIAGMTSYISDTHHVESWKETFIRCTKKIFLAYCAATAIYYVFTIETPFSIITYLNYLIHFNVCGPLYFVALYIQLMLVNRFLYNYLDDIPTNRDGYFKEFKLFLIITIFSAWSTNYTGILGIYGGGGNLFGGTYLILYYIGMLIVKHQLLENIPIIKKVIIGIVSGMIFYIWWDLICQHGRFIDKYVPFGTGFNPPSVSIFILAICVLLLSFSIFSILDQYKFTQWIAKLIGFLGKNTMGIFMYHLFVFDNLLNFFPISSANIWIIRVIYITGMIIISIAIEKIVRNILALVYNAFIYLYRACKNT